MLFAVIWGTGPRSWLIIKEDAPDVSNGRMCIMEAARWAQMQVGKDEAATYAGSCKVGVGVDNPITVSSRIFWPEQDRIS